MAPLAGDRILSTRLKQSLDLRKKGGWIRVPLNRSELY